jgi:hypothetical protein
MDGIFMKHLRSWNSQLPPDYLPFGEPRLNVNTTNRLNANRTQWRQQAALTTVVMPPITQPGSSVGTTDPVGTFGPRSKYVAGVQDPLNGGATDYVVDLYDCRQLPNTATVGSQVNQGGSGKLQQVQFYCVVTSRGRAFVPGAPSKTWTMGSQNYIVNRFTMAHDARGTIVTPPIMLSP